MGSATGNRLASALRHRCRVVHEIISLVTNEIFERFVELGTRWDVVALQRELSEALDGLEEAQRPYVPTNLATALRMFLDSYGPPGVRWSEEP